MKRISLAIAGLVIVALLTSTLLAAAGCGGETPTVTVTQTVTAGGDINSFEECAARGYPVMESYPRRCIANGREFVEKIAGGVTIPTTPAAPPIENGFQILSPTLKVKTPHLNDYAQSPLLVEGEAGGWYFEGEFPVRLLDGNGAVIARGSAMAQGDWMTTDLVAFRVTFTFAPPDTAIGTLVFEKSNPRGEGPPETEEMMVRFTPYLPQVN